MPHKLENLYAKARQSRIPAHVAVIMDGNGRWARAHKLRRISGHRKGAEAIRAAIRAARNLGVRYLTLYAFSTENWTRPEPEVRALWNLMVEFLDSEVPELVRKNIKISHIGNIAGIPEHARSKLLWSEEQTAGSNGLLLTLALNYGGRQEIAHAFNSIIKSGDHLKGEIQIETVSRHLYTNGMPDPDLLIRTSGEQRLSNFLLWQSSYSELYFTPVLWPEFDETVFLEAVIDFQSRLRRFGGV